MDFVKILSQYGLPVLIMGLIVFIVLEICKNLIYLKVDKEKEIVKSVTFVALYLLSFLANILYVMLILKKPFTFMIFGNAVSIMVTSYTFYMIYKRVGIKTFLFAVFKEILEFTQTDKNERALSKSLNLPIAVIHTAFLKASEIVHGHLNKAREMAQT